jgi:hypothetical protein
LKKALKTFAPNNVVEKITFVIHSSLHYRIHYAIGSLSIGYFGKPVSGKRLKTVEVTACRDQEVNLSDLIPDRKLRPV